MVTPTTPERASSSPSSQVGSTLRVSTPIWLKPAYESWNGARDADYRQRPAASHSRFSQTRSPRRRHQ